MAKKSKDRPTIFHVWTLGDPSVGISGDSAAFTVDLSYLDDHDRYEAERVVRKELARLMQRIWMFETYCSTEEEMRAEELRAEEIGNAT